MFDVAVIGKGLFGAAAARYLSQTTQNIALIGPDEPVDWQRHQGVFASHYDQGRITRVLDVDPVWAILAQRSIEQYRTIEWASGVSFYHPVSGLHVGLAAEADDFITRTEKVGRDLAVDFTTYTGPALQERFPFFHFPTELAGIFEPQPAGYINPRSLIAAHLELIRQQGAAIIQEAVVSVVRRREAIELRTAEGQTYQARKVLVAAGAYTNQLLERKLAFELKARTILLAELPPAELSRLEQMPTLIHKAIPGIEGIYLLPPIQYPDGNYYLKIGGGNIPPVIVQSYAELQAWFNAGGSQAEAETLKAVLLSLLPNLQAASFHHKPCVITYTAHNHPYIDAVEPGQIYVAAGGCGSAAKSSNEIGRVAAMLVDHDSWQYDLDWELFKAIDA